MSMTSAARRASIIVGLSLGLGHCSSGDQPIDSVVRDAGRATRDDAEVIEPDGGTLDASAPDTASPDAGVIDLTPEAVFLPRTSITKNEVAVLVARGDPQSEALGQYYVDRRGLRPEQLVFIDVPTGQAILSPDDFAPIREAVQSALGADLQVTVLTWTQPYRVGCMSITSAFAFGFDERFCNRTGQACGPTAEVDYPVGTTRPYNELGFRPSMMLAVRDEQSGRALIDRGVAADATFPTGDGYFIRTTDRARNVRFRQFSQLPSLWSHEGGLELFYFDAVNGIATNLLTETDDVLFYLTGLARVGDIETNTYLPGALADHLTSFGGRVPEAGGQMSVTAWLEAGVTGSYGTTVEPCNFLQKFPNALRLVDAYFRGATLIEAYWQSVLWPGEGLFVGEPLAKPFGHVGWQVEGEALVIETTALRPGRVYQVERAAASDGPWTVVAGGISVDRSRRVALKSPLDGARFYRLVETEAR